MDTQAPTLQANTTLSAIQNALSQSNLPASALTTSNALSADQTFNQVLTQVINAVQVTQTDTNNPNTIGMLNIDTTSPLPPSSEENVAQSLLKDNVSNAVISNTTLSQASSLVGQDANYTLDGIIRSGVIQSIMFNTMNNQLYAKIDDTEVPVENLMQVSPGNPSHLL